MPVPKVLALWIAVRWLGQPHVGDQQGGGDRVQGDRGGALSAGVEGADPVATRRAG